MFNRSKKALLLWVGLPFVLVLGAVISLVSFAGPGAPVSPVPKSVTKSARPATPPEGAAGLLRGAPLPHLKKMLSASNPKEWQQALAIITGAGSSDTQVLHEYLHRKTKLLCCDLPL